jgi:lipoprotein NlpD
MFILLTGCAKQAPPEVSDQSVPLRQPESQTRTVIAGDTLYSIAWESGRDHRELAAWNGISPPYTIVPGQKLRLFPPAKTSDVSRLGTAVHTVQRGETLFSIATRYDLTVSDLCAWNNISPPYTIERGQKLRVIAPGGRVVKRIEPKSATKPTSRTTTPATAKSKTPTTSIVSKPPPASATQWTWPVDGAQVKTSNASSRGINVTGKRGQTIVAASPDSLLSSSTTATF